MSRLSFASWHEYKAWVLEYIPNMRMSVLVINQNRMIGIPASVDSQLWATEPVIALLDFSRCINYMLALVIRVFLCASCVFIKIPNCRYMCIWFHNAENHILYSKRLVWRMKVSECEEQRCQQHRPAQSIWTTDTHHCHFSSALLAHFTLFRYCKGLQRAYCGKMKYCISVIMYFNRCELSHLSVIQDSPNGRRCQCFNRDIITTALVFDKEMSKLSSNIPDAYNEKPAGVICWHCKRSRHYCEEIAYYFRTKWRFIPIH